MADRSQRSRLLHGLAACGGGLLLTGAAHAAGGGDSANTFLWIVLFLVAARLGGLVERFNLPGVLGELVAGIVLGNLGLLGIEAVEPLKTDALIAFIAHLGVVVLLLQVGLESNLKELMAVGGRAFAVAAIGVVVPFALGALIAGPLLLPGLDVKTYLFLGAALSATSVGITGRVFRDMHQLTSVEARVVLGAAVIDDVMGLIILAVLSALVKEGSISGGAVLWTTVGAVLFLAGAIVLGRWLAPYLSRALAAADAGAGMQFTLVIGLGLFLAWLAQAIGLASIVGAFAAGLVLEPAMLRHFAEPAVVRDIRRLLEADGAVERGGAAGAVERSGAVVPDGAAAQSVAERRPRSGALGADVSAAVHARLDDYAGHHHRSLIDPIGYLFVPVFFVYTGMQVNLASFTDPAIVLSALGITAAAIAGKLVAGLAAGTAGKWLVGWGMVPRGEVGLIFAMTGRELGVIDDSVFAVIVIMTVLTTLAAPPVLQVLLRRRARQARRESH